MNQSRKTEIVENHVIKILLELGMEYGDEIDWDVESNYPTGVIRIRVKGGEPD